MSTEPPSSTDMPENNTLETSPSDKKIDTDTSIRKVSENMSEKIDLTKSTSKLIDKIDNSTPAEVKFDANYLTHFCRNRKWPDLSPLKQIFTFSMGNLNEYVSSALLAFILLSFIAWNMLKNYDNLVPFSGGILNILKLVVIYFVIVFVMKLFIKLLKALSFWFDLFRDYFKLFLNPLLNQHVSFLYCYFTNYVNWIIYYPAKIFYFICAMGIALVFFMVIIPIILAFSFILSKLLSLLGNRSSVDTITDTANAFKINAMKAAALLSKAPSMFSKGPGLIALEKAAGTELIGKSLQK